MIRLFILIQFIGANCFDLRFLLSTSTINSPTTTVGKVNCTVPIWGEWTEELSCNDDCGACGTRVLRRRCLTDGCPCEGEAREQRACGVGVCDYPRAACCPPFRIMMIDNEFVCGPQSDLIFSEFRNQTLIKKSLITQSSLKAVVFTTRQITTFRPTENIFRVLSTVSVPRLAITTRPTFRMVFNKKPNKF